MNRQFFGVVFLSAMLLVPALASAQTEAKVGLGFTRYDKLFDRNMDRRETGSTVTDMSIILGLKQDIALGLYSGAELSMAYRDIESAGRSLNRFDVREVTLNLGYAMNLAVVDFDLGIGFKFDVGRQGIDLTSEVPVSDGFYNFLAHAKARFNLGVFNIGARLNAVIPFERNNLNPGTLVEPALLLGVSVGIVRIGLDFALAYRTEPSINGNTVAGGDAWIFHALPSVGVHFGNQSLTFALAYQSEDFNLGIPLIGKSAVAPEIPPMSLTYRGSF